jgi:hypothetical protein
VKLFLHLEVGSWSERGYNNSWLHYASSLSSDVLSADLDNQSEALVADLVIKLIQQAEKVFLLISVKESHLALGNSDRVLNCLIEELERTTAIVLHGSHPMIEERVNRLGEKFGKNMNEETTRAWIRDFAQ